METILPFIFMLIKIYIGIIILNMILGCVFIFLINWPIYKEFEDKSGFVGFNLAGLFFISSKPHKLLYSTFASIAIFFSIFIGSIMNPNYFPIYYENLGPRLTEEYDRYILLKNIINKGELVCEEETEQKEEEEEPQ
ncbi:MAG: hypothetical protein KAS32_26140 [Candidatus Peribacteraceae bacterium]|nr:hypothetical protein [Candidatus Peribacteraceae bacterium]